MTTPSPAVGGTAPLVSLLVSMASVQSGASIAKTLFPVAGVGGTVALRVGFGTLLLCLVLRPWRLHVRRESWLPLLVYGASLGVMNALFYQALARLPIGIAVAVEFIGPLTLAVLTSRRAVDLLWIVLAAAGLGLLLPLLHQTHLSPTGILFALGAGTCWALYIVFGRKVGHQLGARGVALGSIVAAALIVPLGLLGAPAALLSRPVLLRGLAVGALSTALPYSLEMIALARLPTRSFSVMMSLEPAVGALSGLLFLREWLAGTQWLAILLVIAASIGTATTARQEVTAPVPD
ncbi:MAG TPA: EamA family transporter [Steroidobacteraceae bacterium]|nr:EamA family transporter [Steroidobacteraceae bacterium]